MGPGTALKVLSLRYYVWLGGEGVGAEDLKFLLISKGHFGRKKYKLLSCQILVSRDSLSVTSVYRIKGPLFPSDNSTAQGSHMVEHGQPVSYIILLSTVDSRLSQLMNYPSSFTHA